MHGLFDTICSKVSLSLFKSSEDVWASAQWAVNESVPLEFYMNNLEKQAHRAVNIVPQARHPKIFLYKMLACQLATKDKLEVVSYE